MDAGEAEQEVWGYLAAQELAEELKPPIMNPEYASPAMLIELGERAERTRQLRNSLRINPYQLMN
jgi:hypothetical protein